MTASSVRAGLRRDGALVRAGLGEVLGSPPLTALYAGIVIVVSALDAAIVSRTALGPVMATGDARAVGTVLSTAAFFASFVAAGIAYAVLLVVPLTRARTGGGLVAVLATPVGARRLWWTRSVALWVPSLLAGVLAPAGVLGGLRWLAVPAGTGSPLDGWLLLATLVAVPVTFLGLSLVVTAVGLTATPAAGNIIAIGFYGGGSALLGNIVLRAGLGPEAFWWLTAGVAVATWTAALLLGLRVTTSRVVLA
ncbi:hypothetical protein [Actinotalea sp.]|uniref:hypothetical protein n=1 Tax=Actinotalea sp. TaxID=1872145 RepID=UPI002C2AC038|nr:hypothetical protein [Actinotalea sp.]HRA50677.1 hypothetical protein [Actinotalea sp.]